MWNIYLKATNKKKWYTQNSIWRFSKVRLYISFWEAPTQEDITEFRNFFYSCENPTHSFRDKNHVLQHLQGLGIKIKTVISWSSQKGVFFVVYFVRRKFFFNIWVWSQCIVYWMNPQNIYTFTLKKKKILHTLFSIVFKNVESLQCILKRFKYDSVFIFSTRQTM